MLALLLSSACQHPNPEDTPTGSPPADTAAPDTTPADAAQGVTCALYGWP